MTPKVDRFVIFSLAPRVPICITMGSYSFSKYRITSLVTDERMDERTDNVGQHYDSSSDWLRHKTRQIQKVLVNAVAWRTRTTAKWIAYEFHCNYTVFQKSKLFLMFDNNFGKIMWTDFQNSFARCMIRKKILYVHIIKDFHPYLQYVARKSKNVNKFSRWTWQLICLT